VCVNCHRLRHVAIEPAEPANPVVVHRRRRKLRSSTSTTGTRQRKSSVSPSTASPAAGRRPSPSSRNA
jgi:hypothetical protein